MVALPAPIQAALYNSAQQLPSVPSQRERTDPASGAALLWLDAQKERRTSVVGPIRALYDRAGAYNEGLASELLLKLQTQAPKAEKETVKRVLPQLMAELIPSVNTGAPTIKSCFISLVETYITKAVGQEPAKPEDWARPAEAAKACTRSGCDECPEVKRFLEDPLAEHHTMDFGRVGSYHVEITFRFLKIEDSEGNKARLTKTLKGWELQRNQWEEDCKEAIKALQSLPQDKLKELLGDKFDTLITLDVVRADKGTAKRDG
ncbi:hypothetical protein F5883DRAFT_621197 [Diaporthe sp. PMI_573]|nr:hypothetical protein F5883DRAFT_621197 [Diaporthaceae sp. PMI_573]